LCSFAGLTGDQAAAALRTDQRPTNPGIAKRTLVALIPNKTRI
jgi:hypothetical protein